MGRSLCALRAEYHKAVPGAFQVRWTLSQCIGASVLCAVLELLTEILFNPNSPKQIDLIVEKLQLLSEIIKKHDSARLLDYINQSRENIKNQKG